MDFLTVFSISARLLNDNPELIFDPVDVDKACKVLCGISTQYCSGIASSLLSINFFSRMSVVATFTK